MESKEKKQKTISGEVVSDKMDKTIVVSVNRVVQNKLYKKKYTVSKKYKVHDEKNEHKNGDIVEFTPSRPISKDKNFVVIGKVS